MTEEQNMSSTWGTTRTGTIYHSFNPDGSAICRKNIRRPEGVTTFTQEQVDARLAEAWGARVRGFRKCESCTELEAAAQARLEASLAPSSGEGDYLPPAAAPAAAPAAELCGAQVYDPFRGLAFCTKAKLHDRTTAEGPEHLGNYDEMDAAHAAALAEDAAQSAPSGLVVVVQGVRYLVGPWQQKSFGNVDYVEYQMTNPNGRRYTCRAYADAPWGSVARRVWDAQRALR